ncbi:MAG: hypothetical protein PHV18_08240 [Lachnospiraceae bacterium]|nr:hypothetical protein [Lachnospiraceae bacterium]
MPGNDQLSPRRITYMHKKTDLSSTSYDAQNAIFGTGKELKKK